MFKLVENNNFKNVYEEILFEYQDMIEFISYIFGESSAMGNFIGLLNDKYQNPANDNWPIRKVNRQGKVA